MSDKPRKALNRQISNPGLTPFNPVVGITDARFSPCTP
jgi:hypothetical protein